MCYYNTAKAKGDIKMYICVKTNENLDTLVSVLLKNNISLEISRHENLTWVDAKLKEAGFSAWAGIYSREITIHTVGNNDPKVIYRISFDDLETIYDL